MKISAFLLLATLLLTFATAFSQTHRLSFNDTRDVVHPPDSFGFEARFDFKRRILLGGPGDGEFAGLMTIAPWGDASGGQFHQLNFNHGGIFYRRGLRGDGWYGWSKLLTSTGTQELNDGVLVINTENDAPVTLINKEENTWQYQQFLWPNGRVAYMGVSPGNDFVLGKERGGNVLIRGGNVGIGTDAPGTNRLAVEGTIAARKVKVTLGAWPDFVFHETYRLPSLYDLERFINTNKHLPDVPAEKAVLKDGIELGEMNSKLLQKIEELTLYLIEHRKELDALKKDNSLLRNELGQLKKQTR